jgi:predicted dehydrogenase
MTTCTLQAEKLVHAARSKSLVLMVDHITTFSNAAVKAKEILDSGEIGSVYHINAIRFGLGRFSHDTNVIWDLAVHDFATIDYLTGALPNRISARGKSLFESGMIAQANIYAEYSNDMVANVDVSWLSSYQVRKTLFIGSRGSLVFDELEPLSPIRIYGGGVSNVLSPVIVDESSEETCVNCGSSDNPLQQAISHFADCIINGYHSKTDGLVGTRIVKVLEAAVRSIRGNGIGQPFDGNARISGE